MKTFKNNLEIAKYFGKLAKKAYKKFSTKKVEVKDKGIHDLLTNLDTSIEKFLLLNFKRSFPDVKIVSEEFNSKVQATGTYLVIDPIDGTINFANGLPSWAIQMAYIKDDEIKASCIYIPSQGLYYAASNYGAFKNGKKFQVVEKEPLHSIICLETHGLKRHNDLTTILEKDILKFRHFGAESVHSALMAEGNIGGFISADINPWDLLPGYLLMQEAGCYITLVDTMHIFASNKETLSLLEKAVEQISTPEMKNTPLKAKAAHPKKQN